MPHDVEGPAADHGGFEPPEPATPGGEAPPSAVGTPFVPMAETIPDVPDPSSELPGAGGPEESPEIAGVPQGWPGPLPHPCRINLRSGCYRITFKPTHSLTIFYGTMRVDGEGGQTTISGDLYRYLRFPFPHTPGATASAERVAAIQPEATGPRTLFPQPFDIPIYPRSRYYSYLRVTNIQRPPALSYRPCRLILTAEEYIYTQPPAGSFDGTFPAPPGSRTVSIVLERKTPPPGFTSSYFAGTLYANGVAKGSFTMGWVSELFRRATL